MYGLRKFSQFDFLQFRIIFACHPPSYMYIVRSPSIIFNNITVLFFHDSPLVLYESHQRYCNWPLCYFVIPPMTIFIPQSKLSISPTIREKYYELTKVTNLYTCACTCTGTYTCRYILCVTSAFTLCVQCVLYTVFEPGVQGGGTRALLEEQIE